LPLAPILSHINSVHALPTDIFNIHFNTVFQVVEYCFRHIVQSVGLLEFIL
jgi:hypothetical protein